MLIFHRWPGRAHDARVWHRSPIFKALPDLCYVEGLRIDETFHILGDSAYPLSNHLMVPYKQRKSSLTQMQKMFNTHLASKRSVIERAFGLLGLRFPRLLHLKFRSNDKRIISVVAACVLHNWCLMEDDDDDSIFKLADEDHTGLLQTDVNDYFPAALIIGNRRANAGGNTKREMLSAIISNL